MTLKRIDIPRDMERQMADGLIAHWRAEGYRITKRYVAFGDTLQESDTVDGPWTDVPRDVEPVERSEG